MQTLDKAYKQILQFYGMTEKQMTRKCREQPYAFFRHCAMKYLWENYAKPLRVSMSYLSKKYFNRHYTLIIHARESINDFRDVNAPEWHDYLALCRHMEAINGTYADCPTLYPVLHKPNNTNQWQHSSLAASA